MLQFEESNKGLFRAAAWAAVVSAVSVAQEINHV